MKKYIIIVISLLFAGSIYGQESVEPTEEICTGNERTILIIDEDPLTVTLPPISSFDTDGDGLPDIQEPPGDCDGDGIPNVEDPDSDNDGFLDGVDQCVCEFGSFNNGCPYNKRMIFFTHGFQGNEQSWNLQEDWVNENYLKARPESITYTQDQNALDAAANRMRDLIQDQIAIHQSLEDPNPANFLIAHSMGGIVARNAFPKFNNYELPLDGFVTIGSAHHGVGAADTRVNNPEDYLAIVDEACNALGLSILQEAISGEEEGLAVRDYVLLTLEWLNEEAICDLLSPLAFSQVETGWSQPIEDELTTQDALNWPAPLTTHNAAFYGVEPDEQLVTISPYNGTEYEVTVNGVLTPKFAGGIIEKAGNRPIWEADDLDDVGIEAFANNLALLEHRKQTLLVQVDIAHAILHYCTKPIPNPLCVYLTLKHLDLISANLLANNRGFQFMDNVNGMWRNIIQADRIEVVETEETCVCFNTDTGEETYSEPVNGVCDNSSGMVDCVIVSEETLVIIKEDSDGFVLESSAMNMPDATYPPQLMLGSSHFQMRNDSEAEKAFEKLLNTNEDDPQFSWFNSDE